MFKIAFYFVKKNYVFAFSEPASDIQNKIIHCISAKIEDQIKAMIDKKSFVGVMFDETRIHFAICWWKGKFQEKFLGYVDDLMPVKLEELHRQQKKFENFLMNSAAAQNS